MVKRYRGAYLWDPDENEYLDSTSGIGVCSFGGGDALSDIWDAMSDLRDTCGICGDIGTDWYNSDMIQAAEFILPRIPILSTEKKIYFTEAGTLANEAALTLCWAHFETQGEPKRKAVVCFEGAFHGRSGFVINLLDPRKPERFFGYPISNFSVIRAPFPSKSLKNPLEIMKQFFGRLTRDTRKSVAGVMIEVIQGEGGICIPDGDALRWWCDAWRNEGAPIIADEIQAGIGRTGKLMSYEHFGILPDIATVAKHFGSGVPVAAMIGPANMDWEEYGRRSESFQGSPISARAAQATIRHVYEHQIVERNAAMGDVLTMLLKKEIEPYRCVREVRGIGLMQGIEFQNIEIRNRVKLFAERLGVRVAGAGFAENPTIRLLPSFAMSEGDIGVCINILKRAIEYALR